MKRKGWWLIPILIAVVLIGFAAAGMNGTDDSTQETQPNHDDLREETSPPTQDPVTFETVSYVFGNANMQLSIPEDWCYEICPATQDAQGFGIRFWPEGETGDIILSYYDAYGVCGTGLEIKEQSIGGYPCHVGTYDQRKVWDYISVSGLPGHYVFQNNGIDDWYFSYEEELSDILDSAVLAKDMLWEAEAVAIAAQALEVEEDCLRASFDGATGMWTVKITDDNSGAQVMIDLEGNVFYEYALCGYPTADKES